VCVCARARARVCVCVCVCTRTRERKPRLKFLVYSNRERILLSVCGERMGVGEGVADT
jgi:hypothetical protein